MQTMPTLNLSVMARLDRAIHLSMSKAIRWIPRSSREMTLLFVLALILTPLPARAASISDASYKATMTSLDEIETLINSTITELHSSMSIEDARTALPHLQDRLQWMRDAKVAAARIDTSHTLRSHSTDSQRAQCIIMRAGLMDEAFQDVMVNVLMKAHGTANSALLPMTPASNTSRTCK